MDDRSFQALVQRQEGTLLRLARRLTRSEAEAQDLVQDALERAWRGRHRQLQAGAQDAWLRTILVNRARDLGRRSGVVAFSALDDAPEPLAPASLDPQAVVAAADEESRLRAALRELPDDERVAVVLCDGEGWTARNVAAITDSSEEATRKRVHRGRTRLVAVLGGMPSTSDRPAAACAHARAAASDYLDGHLAEDEVAALRSHLHDCERCPPLLRALEAVRTAIARDSPTEPATPARQLVDEVRRLGH